MSRMAHKSEKTRDDRITIKLDKNLWKIISDQIKLHPEWGVKSVSDFIRRAVDNELNTRKRISERKVIELNLSSRDSQEDSRDKHP